MIFLCFKILFLFFPFILFGVVAAKIFCGPEQDDFLETYIPVNSW
jgi:hypothetical protein